MATPRYWIGSPYIEWQAAARCLLKQDLIDPPRFKPDPLKYINNIYRIPGSEPEIYYSSWELNRIFNYVLSDLVRKFVRESRYYGIKVVYDFEDNFVLPGFINKKEVGFYIYEGEPGSYKKATMKPFSDSTDLDVYDRIYRVLAERDGFVTARVPRNIERYTSLPLY